MEDSDSVRLDAYHAVRHVNPRTTRLYTHFNTAESKKRMESLEIGF